jgi:hypothetical protein
MNTTIQSIYVTTSSVRVPMVLQANGKLSFRKLISASMDGVKLPYSTGALRQYTMKWSVFIYFFRFYSKKKYTQ